MKTESPNASFPAPAAKVPLWRPLIAIAVLLVLFLASQPLRSRATPFAAAACFGFAIAAGLRGRRDRAASVVEIGSTLVGIGAIIYLVTHLPR